MQAGCTRGRLELVIVGCRSVCLLLFDRWVIIGDCLSVGCRLSSVVIGRYIECMLVMELL